MVRFVLSLTFIAYQSSVNNFVILLLFLYKFLVHLHVLCVVLMTIE